TILYNMEAREFKIRKMDSLASARREVEVPGVRFDETTSSYGWGKTREPFRSHPIRTSMRLVHRAMSASDPSTAKREGKDKGEATEVSVRHPRPVYYMHASLPTSAAGSLVGALALPGLPGGLQAAATWAQKASLRPDDSAVFLVTREENWNEEKPFVMKNKAPRYTPTKDEDPKKGTVDEERRGPFPIGVAVETQVPASWFDKDANKAPQVRVAVIGSGGAFVGASLPPMKEKLFLDTVNWLLGRDDLLARDSETWQYPRVELTSLEQKCWFVLCYGLPFAFVYLGAMVGLMRRMR
ncbi:MAG TPA: hypothetical protein VFE62_06575, partial [Gemmataceae bacterium]|nr:hypothetical protein [Gemmataceae bacterium]